MEKLYSLKIGNDTILGMIHLPKSKSKAPCVLLCYGFNSNRVEVQRLSVKFARRLVGIGIGCIRIDFLGTGVSSGYFHNYTLEDRVNQALLVMKDSNLGKYINLKCWGVIGFSDGCKVALELSTVVSNIKSICLWSPNIINEEIPERREKDTVSKQEKIVISRNGIDSKLCIPHWTGLWINLKYYSSIGSKYVKYLDELLIRIPIMCCFGERDNIVIPTKNYIFSLKSTNLTTKVIKYSNHIFSSYTYTNELIESTLEHFYNTLIETNETESNKSN